MSITVMKQMANYIDTLGGDSKKYRQAIAEAENQEPVEWGVDWGPDGNSVSIIKRLAGGGIEVVGWEYAPHPPQRQWVGLTDEEIAKAEKAIWDFDCAEERESEAFLRFYRAIEAKLKEKNT